MIDLWATFIFGLLSGFHCIGMCGGLVVTYTACDDNGSWERKIDFKPHLLYNISRLVSYALVGLILGKLGSAFNISSSLRAGIQIFAGIFMLVVAVNMLKIVPWFRFLMPRTPGFLLNLTRKVQKRKSKATPVFIGLLNGLMPCTPLLAMQIKALSTGNAFYGALTMLVFGLGTVPLMFGFGSIAGFIQSAVRGKILKLSGVVVFILALIMLNRGLLLSGSKYNLTYAFKSIAQSISGEKNSSASLNNDVQEIKMTVQGYYEPDSFVVKRGVKVRLIVNRPESNNFCTKQLIFPAFGISRDLPDNGSTVIEFTPNKTGTFPFSCGMGMIPGKIIVKDIL